MRWTMFLLKRHGIWGVRFAGRIPALLTLLTLTLAAPLLAADVTLTFDESDAANGSGVGNRYQSKGLASLGAGILTTGEARSAPNVAVAGRTCELCVPFMEGKFTNPHHNYVTAWVKGNSSRIGLTAYDLGGNVVGTANIPANPNTGTYYALTVTTTARNISRFVIGSGPGDAILMVDNLRFDDIGLLEGPDFFFYQNLARTTLVPGGPGVTVRFYVGRRAGSTGNISPSISNLPSGVAIASITPNPINGDRVEVTLVATVGAKNTGGKEVVATMWGYPSTSAGAYGPRTTSLPIVVVDQFNMRIVSIEVTQGIQPFDIPGPNLANRAAPVGYAGVRLAEDGKTSVKVYFNQSSNYTGVLPNYGVRLYGWRIPNPANPAVREPLVDSPIIYDKIVGTPTQGQPTLTDNHRLGTEGATANFILPWTWSRGTIQLEAVIEYPPSFFPPTAWDTDAVDNRLLMTGIKFNHAVSIGIVPIELKVTNPPGLWPLPDPWDVFHQTQKVIPGPYYTAATGWWRATLDITDVWNQTEKACGFLGLSGCPEDNTGRKNSVIARMQDLADDIKEGWYVPRLIEDAIVGVFPANTTDQRLGGVTVMDGECKGPYWGCKGNPVAIARGHNRPLSSVAHEVAHMLGRNHAGGACDADKEESPFDPWEPDKQGFLSSVSYDWESGTTLFPNRTGGNPMAWDIMSYCGQNGNQDPDKWTSVRGWEWMLDTLMKPVQNQPQSAPPSAEPFQASPQQAGPQQAPPPVLVVRGFTNSDGFVMVTKIGRGNPNRPIPADPTSPFKAQAKNAAGAVLAEVRMLQEKAEDGDGVVFLSAHVPAAGVQSIDIVKDTTPVARRIRSANVPTVAGLTVQPDVIRAGVRITRAQWTATDADGGKLMAKVDYSADNGATWKPVYFGPNANAADLSAYLLAKSTAGKIRVRVSDGFNEAESISNAFATAGSPPSVNIYSPTADQALKEGGPVQLQGRAMNDQGALLAEAGLKWYEGETLLGVGENVTVRGLKAGVHTFRLVATDAGGRAATATVTARIER